jgi:glutamyl-tRNA(Gln) amidotransferase subunit E
MADYDYKALGLRVGIEIHQQLDSKKKLFCRCPNRMQGTRTPDFQILRKHRPVLGETGEFDHAMLVEFKKNMSVIYEGYYDCNCTYELDETPPFRCDEEALDIGLEIGLLLQMRIVREMHVCRKNYVDGSVPGGFQRTMELGKDGALMLASGKQIGIENIFLEEDAARRIKNEEKTVYFRIDRLGIPLVEITTAPDLNDPQEARDAAYRLGMLLRSTRKVKKVLGAIRQDINISIKDGNRIEVKGVQKLDWIPELIKYECQRQLALIEIRETLKNKGITPEQISGDVVDLTKILQNTACKFVNAGIKKGEIVFGMRANGFKGLMGKEVQPNRRFGTELAGKVRVLTGLKGLIHSDEDLINKYNFTADEIKAIESALKLQDGDAFVIILGEQTMVSSAFQIVLDRIKMAFVGIPPETRQAKEDGTHEFLRELHGGSRLYPDTDSIAITVTDDRIARIKAKLGAYPWDMISQYAEKYKLTADAIENLIMDGNIKLFEKLAAILPDNPMLVITTLNDSMKVLHREERDIDNLREDHFVALFEALKAQTLAKEAIDPVLRIWIEFPSLSLTEAKDKAGIASVDLKDVEKTIKEIVDKNASLVEQKGRGATGPLMGDIMKAIGRGTVDGKILNQMLNKAMEPYLQKSAQPPKKGGKN